MILLTSSVPMVTDSIVNNIPSAPFNPVFLLLPFIVSIISVVLLVHVAGKITESLGFKEAKKTFQDPIMYLIGIAVVVFAFIIIFGIIGGKG